MRRTFCSALVMLFPFVLLPLAQTGCSRVTDDEDDLVVERPKKGGVGGGGAGDTVAMKAIKIEKTGTIEGVVTLQGSPNVAAMTKSLQETMSKNTNKDHCLSMKAPDADKSQYTWVFDGNNNLKNVVVFIRPADTNSFFDVADLAKQAKAVEIDQPYCAFEPHVGIYWPKYVDPQNPSKDVNLALPTQQTFAMKNSATVAHNTAWGSDAGGSTGGGSEIIPPGGKLQIKNIRPSYRGPVKLSCSIHPWMVGYVWALDHPFAAKSGDDGKFKITGVPAGVKLRVIAWHEGAGFLDGPNGREITVEADKPTTANFTAKAP